MSDSNSVPPARPLSSLNLPDGKLAGEGFDHNAMIMQQVAFGDTHAAVKDAKKQRRNDIQKTQRNERNEAAGKVKQDKTSKKPANKRKREQDQLES